MLHVVTAQTGVRGKVRPLRLREPRRVCRRPQLLVGMERHEQDDEHVFPDNVVVRCHLRLDAVDPGLVNTGLRHARLDSVTESDRNQ